MRQTKSKIDSNTAFFTGYGVDIVRRLYDSVKFSEGKKLISKTFYFNDDLADSIDENGKTNNVFKFLKENKVIKDYRVDVHNEDSIYYIEYCCEIIPENIIEYAKDLSIIPKYTLKFGKKNEKEAIILNDKYVLTCPHYDGAPRNLFEVIYNHSRVKLTKSFIEKEIAKSRREEFTFNRKLSGVLVDLGFKKEIKKIFLPHTSDQAIYFRNEVYGSELKNDNLNLMVLKTQLSKLKTYNKK